jgi:hypothetical protein
MFVVEKRIPQPVRPTTVRAPEDVKGIGIISLGMALFAFCVGWAINLNNGYYDRRALLWLTLGLAFGLAGLVTRSKPDADAILLRSLPVTLALGIAGNAWLLLSRRHVEPLPVIAILVLTALALLQVVSLGWFRVPVVVVAAGLFCYCGVVAIRLPDPQMDVYHWQQHTSEALLEHHNPYELRIHPHYLAPQFYPPGALDHDAWLTVAFPYPPLSLLMVLPSFMLTGDIRYAQLAAIALTVVLMTLARRGRIAALAAMLFLLTPRVLFILWNGWTEPLMVLNFSLVMFCACRWRKGLPWALGLFLITKQTAVWAVPLVPLLVDGPKRWKQLFWMAVKAGVVVVVINAPFVLWNFHEFVRAVVLLRLVPPFRSDALTYLVWIYSLTGRIPPTWIGAIVGLGTAALVLWKAPRTPAGFAMGVTLVTTLFFAFSKQAFANYYYFTIATACWAVVAAEPVERRFSAASAST